MTYLEEFTSRVISETSTSFTENMPNKISMQNVDERLLYDLIDLVESNLDKHKSILSLKDKIFNKNKFIDARIIRAERKYFFNEDNRKNIATNNDILFENTISIQETFISANSVTFQEGVLPISTAHAPTEYINNIIINYGLWVFTLLIKTIDEILEREHVSESVLDLIDKKLYFQPLLIPYGSKTDEFGIDQKINLVFNNENTSIACPCLSSEKNYNDCCYSLLVDTRSKNFHTPKFIGFHYIDFVKEINDVLIQKSSNIPDYENLADLLIADMKNTSLLLPEYVFHRLAKDFPIPSLGKLGKTDTSAESKKLFRSEAIDQNIDNMSKIIFSRSLHPDTVWVVTDDMHTIIDSATNAKEIYYLLEKWMERKSLEALLKAQNRVLEAMLNSTVIKKIEIFNLIDSWSFKISNKVTNVIKEATELYYNGNYTEAVHLLMPCVESALREWAIIHHEYRVPITKQMIGTHSVKEVSLKELIDTVMGDSKFQKDKLNSFNRETIKQLFHQLLTRDGQFLNLRNELSHKFENKSFGAYEFRIIFYLFDPIVNNANTM
jgi:hypothetical protein